MQVVATIPPTGDSSQQIQTLKAAKQYVEEAKTPKARRRTSKSLDVADKAYRTSKSSKHKKVPSTKKKRTRKAKPLKKRVVEHYKQDLANGLDPAQVANPKAQAKASATLAKHKQRPRTPAAQTVERTPPEHVTAHHVYSSAYRKGLAQGHPLEIARKHAQEAAQHFRKTGMVDDRCGA